MDLASYAEIITDLGAGLFIGAVFAYYLLKVEPKKEADREARQHERDTAFLSALSDLREHDAEERRKDREEFGRRISHITVGRGDAV